MTTRYSSNYEIEYQTQRKKVFRNAEIEHIWAQQKLDEGRNPQGNVFFEGPSLFSYGHHFETARFVRSDVVFVTTRRYSVTTSRRARGAVGHLKQFDVETFDDHNKNVEAYLVDLTASLERISRMRSDTKWSLERYREDLGKAAAYVALFKTHIRKDLYAAVRSAYARREVPFTVRVLAGIKKRQAAARVADKAARERKAAIEAIQREAQQVFYDAWKAGDEVPYSAKLNIFPVALRVKNDEVQTSRGAAVPVIEARKLWHTMRKDLTAVIGMRVGHYTVDRIDPVGNNLIVGCHTIPMREIARMAVKLGLEREAA